MTRENEKIFTVEITQARRREAAEILRSRGVILAEGYGDESSTTWKIGIATYLEAEAIQEILWAEGYDAVSVEAYREEEEEAVQ